MQCFAMSRSDRISDQMLLDDVIRVANHLETDYLRFKDYQANGGKYSNTTFKSRFSTWKKAQQKAGLNVRKSDDYKRTDLVGQKFGLLTVVDEAGYSGKKKLWLCECNCGNTIVVPTDRLKSGRVISCGHLRPQRATHAAKMKASHIVEGVKEDWFSDTISGNNTTGYLGVGVYQTYSGKTRYRARLVVNYKEYEKSGFKTAEDAYQARLSLEEEHLPQQILDKLYTIRSNGLIKLQDYADLHNLPIREVRNGVYHDGFKTAVKIGSNWFLDPKDRMRERSEIISNHSLIDEVAQTYHDTQSLTKTAQLHKISVQKARKLLITSDTYSTPLIDKVNKLQQQGFTVPEIAKKVGKSENAVSSYLPYEKGIYNEQLSQGAKNIRKSRKK